MTNENNATANETVNDTTNENRGQISSKKAKEILSLLDGLDHYTIGIVLSEVKSLVENCCPIKTVF